MSDCEVSAHERSVSPRESKSPRRVEKRHHRSRSRSSGHRYRDDRRESRREDIDREQPKPCKCLGVFGLSLYTKERDLKDMFRKCGPIEDCTIVYDRRSGRSRGFGFVRFKYQEDADEARELMNGKEFDSRKIRVDYSVTQKPHAPTPGVYMGKTTDYGGRDDRRRRRSYSRGRSYDSRSRSRSRGRRR